MASARPASGRGQRQPGGARRGVPGQPLDLFGGRARRGGQDDDKLTLEGTVERIVFAGDDGGFTVARLAVEGERDLVTVVGALMGVPAGARVRVTGKREQSSKFGPQFRVEGFTELSPSTLAGIEKYLGSGLIKGIGPEFARRIVERFGLETLEVLDREPGRVGEVPGIGRGRAESIGRVWRQQRSIRQVMVFLQGHGVSPAFAARIYKRYGEAAIARVRENPYRLATDVWGIGFKSADKVAADIGIDKTSPLRIEAGVRHVLAEAGGSGHVFLPRADLVEAAARLLDADVAAVETAVDAVARAGDATIDGDSIYETQLYQAEIAVAQTLAKLMGARSRVVPLDVDKALAWYEESAGFALANQQAEAVRRALIDKVVVITGGPGVGKTTIVRGIVSILLKKGVRIALAAPTGRAAKRLAEATGQPAATLHRLLEWRPAEGKFGRNAETPVEADLVVIDEASMIDVRLMADLLAALSPSCRLVLVGDVDQLPSVGPGTVLADVIASRVVTTVRLTEIFRQAAASLIVRNAHRIHQGDLPEIGASAEDRDFFFLEEEDAGRGAALVRDLVAQRLPKRYGFSPGDIQVLTPMHRGELGAANLNQLLQEALAPTGQPELRRGGRALRLGDRVMQARNDYDKDVFNGDVGRVVAVDPDEGVLTVRFDDRLVTYEADETDELLLAYAATVHKSQGSEYAAVVIPVHTQHFVLLQRNLLYTAVTRGKKLVVLVGSRRALGIAVRNAEVALRHSRLAERLAARVE